MINTQELRNCIDNSGLKMNYIAEKLSLTPQGLYNKINNVTEFKSSELAILGELLGYDKINEIFFKNYVHLNSTNVEEVKD